MKTLETELIEMGLKTWEKGNIKRIYVKSSAIKKLIAFDEQCKHDSYLEKNTSAIFQRIDSEGAWLNCSTKKLESKKASVLSWFANSEFAQRFGY